MLRVLLVALLVALSSAFFAPLASKASSSIVMNEAAAKAAWLKKAGTPGDWKRSGASASPMTGRIVPTGAAAKAPKSGWTLTLAGGTRTVADVYEDQKKAAKKY